MFICGGGYNAMMKNVPANAARILVHWCHAFVEEVPRSMIKPVGCAAFRTR